MAKVDELKAALVKEGYTEDYGSAPLPAPCCQQTLPRQHTAVTTTDCAPKLSLPACPGWVLHTITACDLQLHRHTLLLADLCLL